MKFGGAMFFTDYSMTGQELAIALEERGFDSIWVPEHSHIPLSTRPRSPAAAELRSHVSGPAPCALPYALLMFQNASTFDRSTPEMLLRHRNCWTNWPSGK